MAAIHIEDQITPKRCGHLDGKEVIPLAEMEMKLEAALTDPHRSGFLHHRPHRRARRQRLRRRDRKSAEPSPNSASMRSLSKRRNRKKSWPKFRAGFPMSRCSSTSSKAARHRCCRWSAWNKWATGSPSIRRKRNAPAIHAMRTALATLKREGTTESIDAALTTFKERDRVVGLDDWQKLERQFMAVQTDKA